MGAFDFIVVSREISISCCKMGWAKVCSNKKFESLASRCKGKMAKNGVCHQYWCSLQVKSCYSYLFMETDGDVKWNEHDAKTWLLTFLSCFAAWSKRILEK